MTGTAQATPIGRRLSGTIPATSSLDLDATALTDFTFLRYFLSAKNAAGSLVKGMDMSLINKSGVLSDSVFGRNGSLPLAVNAVVSGSDAVLRITNSNAFSVNVEAIRLIME